MTGIQALVPHMLLTSLIAVFACGCSSTQQATDGTCAAAAPGAVENGQDPAEPWDVGNPAPRWSLENAAGETRSLEDYRGKVVVLDFWATWCPPCRRAMPSLQQLHEQYAGDPVVVLSLSVDQNPQDAIDYVQQHGFTFELLVDADATSDQYGVTGIPTLVIIGPDGRIAHRHVGYLPNLAGDLSEVIDQTLDEYGM